MIRSMHTFNEKRPKCVERISRYLPAGGEDGFRLIYNDADVVLEILDGSEAILKLEFSEVATVYVARFPGVDTTCLNNESHADVGELLEYEASPASAEWMRFSLWLDSPMRHFQLVLMGAHRRLDVFATKVRISRMPQCSGLER